MPFCKFRRSDGVYLGGFRWDRPTHDDSTEVVLELADFPDPAAERWDGDQGTRPVTQEEQDAEADRMKQDEVQAAFDESLGRLDRKINAVILWLENEHGRPHAQMLTELRGFYQQVVDADPPRGRSGP